MSNLNELTAQLQVIDDERAVLHAQLTILQNQLLALHERRTPIVAEMSKIKNAELKLAGGNQWDILLDGTDDTTYTAYWDIVNAYPFLWASGQFEETAQRVISLKFDREDKSQLQKAVDVLKDIIPAYKPLKIKDRATIVFEIFEHTLGEYGSYHLYLDVADNMRPSVTHRYSEDIKFETLYDALAYIQDKHYYKTSNPVYRDDDEFDM